MGQVVDWSDKGLYVSVINAVEDIGVDRRKAQGKIDEADFLAGAMAAMTALGLQPVQYPARWTLLIMIGRSALDQRIEDLKQAEQEAVAAAQRTGDETLN